MAGLGSARPGFLPLLLAIRRRGLGGGARGLLRPLQAQHQLDQLFLAQTLKLNTTHPALESAKTPSLKGVGNYMAAYHTCVTHIMRAHDGYVAKYMGDGVLAYFGIHRLMRTIPSAPFVPVWRSSKPSGT